LLLLVHKIPTANFLVLSCCTPNLVYEVPPHLSKDGDQPTTFPSITTTTTTKTNYQPAHRLKGCILQKASIHPRLLFLFSFLSLPHRYKLHASPTLPLSRTKTKHEENHLHHHHQDKLTLKGSALEGDEKLLLLLLQEAKGTTVSDVRVEEEEEKGSSNVVAVVVVTIADAIAISLPRSKCEW